MFTNHWHVFPEGTINQEVPGEGTLGKMLEIMNQVGVEKAVAFAPFLNTMPQDTWYKIKFHNERECNEWLYKSLKNYPGIVGFITTNPNNSESCAILNEYFEKGFKGVKLHPPIFQMKINDPKYDKFYRTVEKLGIPISIHTGVHGWEEDKYLPGLLKDVIRKFPALKIILEHVGGAEYFDQALSVLIENKNCFAGITQSSGRCKRYHLSMDKINKLLDKIGTDRIIYGLDYPFNSDKQGLTDDIKWIAGWGIAQAEQDKILGANLEKLIS
ncbi:MAG: amidohydrolase family protein [Victivallaceae bacterium]|nr:amidohydrolase family protein [Victivallaceae bacterium]